METNDILNLAKLSRLEITTADAENYKKDFAGILNYIDSISQVQIELADHYQTNLNKNYMRDDEQSYVAGEFTANILANAPAHENGFFKVKKVL